jgi:hypothetical protein
MKQHVPGGMAERVVVCLEPVQVSQHKHAGTHVAFSQALHKVSRELVAVAQAGDRIGQRLHARR